MDIRLVVIMAVATVTLLVLRSDLGRTSFPVQYGRGDQNEGATPIIGSSEGAYRIYPGVRLQQLFGVQLGPNRPRSLTIEELDEALAASRRD